MVQPRQNVKENTKIRFCWLSQCTTGRKHWKLTFIALALCQSQLHSFWLDKRRARRSHGVEGIVVGRIRTSPLSFRTLSLTIKWKPDRRRRKQISPLLANSNNLVFTGSYINIRANGCNNSQHCWPNNIGSCYVRLHVVKRLTGFKLCATTPNRIQQHVTGCANRHIM